MSRKKSLAIITFIVCSIALTFLIPAMQWLMNKLIAHPDYTGSLSSFAIILCITLWLKRKKTASFRTVSFQWRAFFYLALVAVLALLIFNIQNQPVSKITGQARSPFEVLDLIILLPITEELVFRGAIWAMIDKLAKGDPAHIAVLTVTSLLFGVEHLGYWAQSSWPLPIDAYFHAISMIFAGVFFGFFRLKSGSLAIPAVLHMLANGVVLLFQ